jgi:hypothetical protein
MRTPIDELIEGTRWELEYDLRHQPEGLTQEATEALLTRLAGDFIMDAINRWAEMQQGPLVPYLLLDAPYAWSQTESPHQERFEGKMPNSVPFVSIPQWPRMLGHLLACVVETVKANMRESGYFWAKPEPFMSIMESDPAEKALKE